MVSYSNCIGFTQFSISTHVADTTVTVYSDPTTI